MFKKILVMASGLLATGPLVGNAIAHTGNSDANSELLKNSLFQKPTVLSAQSREGHAIINTLIEKSEAGRLKGQIFGLSEDGEVESLGSREDLETLKKQIRELQVEMARAHDVVPTTEF